MKIVTKRPTIFHTEQGIKIAGTQTPLYSVIHLLKEEWPDHLVQLRFSAGRKQVEEYWRVRREKRANGQPTTEEVQWPTWWPDDTTPGTVIHIIETEGAPMISHSRVSIYDVMEVYDDGSSASEIREIYNLSSYQVKVALQYIEAHREKLEPALKEALLQKAERERYYREFAAAHTKWRMETNPLEMTPRRAALKALIEQRRQALEEL